MQTQALLTHMQRGGRSQGMRGDRVDTVCSPESEYSCSVAEKWPLLYVWNLILNIQGTQKKKPTRTLLTTGLKAKGLLQHLKDFVNIFEASASSYTCRHVVDRNLAFYVSFPSSGDILCIDGIPVLSRALNVQCLLLSLYTSSYQPTYLASHLQPAPHPKAELLPLDLVPFEIIIPGASSDCTIWGQTFHLAMYTLHYSTYSGSTASLVTI